MSVVYEAFFVQGSLDSKLAKDIEFKHITTEFKPAKSHEHLYGQQATFVVTGYGNDEVNEGYKVKLVSCESDELRDLYEAIPIPHITLSVSPEGKAVNTKNLDFGPTDEFTVLTKFGGFLGKPIYKE